MATTVQRSLSTQDETRKIDNAFWRETTARLRRFIGGRVKDSHAAEDLVQDTLMKAQAGIALVAPDKVTAWLFRIARNLVIDHYRSREVRRTDALRDEPAQAASDGLSASDLSGCVRSMVGRLPESDRQVLERTDLGALTQVQLAKELGLSVPGAKSRVQRARAQLRDLFVRCCGVRAEPSGGGIDHACECAAPDYCSGRDGNCCSSL